MGPQTGPRIGTNPVQNRTANPRTASLQPARRLHLPAVMSGQSIHLPLCVFLSSWVVFSCVAPVDEDSTHKAAGDFAHDPPDPYTMTFVGWMASCGPNASWRLADYGCFCGIGGQGSPRDAWDSTCQRHDQCWDDAPAGCDCYGASYRVSHNRGANCPSPTAELCDNGDVCAQHCCLCDQQFLLDQAQNGSVPATHHNLDPASCR